MLDICSVCFFLHFDVEMDVREKNVLKINEILGKRFGVPDCHLKYINTKTKQNHLFTNPIKPMRSFDEIALD